MRQVADLTEDELRTIVRQIKMRLWFVGQGRYDRNKEWGVDAIEDVASILAHYGLEPEEEQNT